MEIIILTNTTFKSNTFIIKGLSGGQIIIDPGDYSVEETIIALDHNPISFVILTHEHIDHIAGIDQLAEVFDFKLICSSSCYAGIKDPRINLSEYLEDLSPFKVNKKAMVFDEDFDLRQDDILIRMYLTPGHSQGSICIKIENNFFSGDTILNNTKVTLTLPGARTSAYNESMRKLKNVLRNGDIIFPGHGTPFEFYEGLIESLEK